LDHLHVDSWLRRSISCSHTHLGMPALNPANHFSYLRHRPERSLIYQIIETHWPFFLEQQIKADQSIPRFVQKEFNAFLDCGIPENGFVRTYCYQCRYSGLVAFSCKMRGFCPSCLARRMNDEAAHLVDHVLPQEVPFRQWVLSFPFKLRYLMAFDQEMTRHALKVMLQTIASFQKKRARRLGIQNPQMGAVTFIQRFGSALNLNVHFHVLVSDGVFSKSGQQFDFFPLPRPSPAELFELVEKIKRRVLKKAEAKQTLTSQIRS